MNYTLRRCALCEECKRRQSTEIRFNFKAADRAADVADTRPGQASGFREKTSDEGLLGGTAEAADTRSSN